MNQNIHKKVNGKITQNASIIFSQKRPRMSKLYHRTKLFNKKKNKQKYLSAGFGELKELLETFFMLPVLQFMWI